MVPIFCWLGAMQAAGAIGAESKPLIDTTSLPLLETALTGGVLVQHWPATVLSPATCITPAHAPMRASTWIS